MMLRTICFFLLATCSWTLLAQPQVLVSIKPLQLLISSLSQGEIDVEYLVDPRFSPHDYALRPSDVRKIQRTDLMIWVGEELEPFLRKPLQDRSENTQLELLNIPQMPLIKAGHDHQHDTHSHAHQVDPHLWLGFDTGVIAAQAITERLITLSPEKEAHYQQQLTLFSQRLSTLKTELQQQLKPYSKQGYFVFHDGYSYFERSLSLNRLGEFTINPQQRPGAKTLSHIRQQIEQQQVQCIFAEPQFDGAILQSISEDTGAYIGQLDPLAIEVSNDQDAYFNMLRSMAADFIDCLQR